MTIVVVALAATCPLCGAGTRIYRDLSTGRTTTRELRGGYVHECQGMALETIERSTVCDKCSWQIEDGTIIGEIAVTSLGRVIEWYFPYPIPPYDEHVCVSRPRGARALRSPMPVGYRVLKDTNG